jgi:hypothetical protein
MRGRNDDELCSYLGNLDTNARLAFTRLPDHQHIFSLISNNNFAKAAFKPTSILAA